MKFKSILTGVLLAFGLGTAAVAADVKVGFVYVGPIGDGGWTYEHDKGRLAVEKHFGDRVETIYQENVPEGADADISLLPGGDDPLVTVLGEDAPMAELVAEAVD